MFKKTILFIIIISCLPISLLGYARDDAFTLSSAPNHAIASAHPLATKSGIKILEAGGNAFDAAITVASVLAVVEPYGSGIGGGGFWLLHRTEKNQNIMLDSREKAPMAAHKNMYVKNNTIIPGASINGPLSAGIPGIPAALDYLAKFYGNLPLHQTLGPAIHMARHGFSIDEKFINRLQMRLDVIKQYPSTAKILLNNNQSPKAGDRLVQKDLANTLERIANQGSSGFYRGKTADLLIQAVKKGGGLWTHQDLRDYKVIERNPIIGFYKNHKIITAAPPSSGGIVLLTALNILAGYDLKKTNNITRIHLIVEAMKRAYRDRAVYLGDPDFVSIPVQKLLSLQYATQLRRTINTRYATPAQKPVHHNPKKEGTNTTHFSILDKMGNRVSATLSINYSFGSGFIAEGTGVILNDEMDDFSSQPGIPNVYGLVGGESNAIAPGKRMLSSMTPTFIESNNGVAILGTPGGSRIISMVLLAALNQITNKNPADWVSIPRFHHQYLPDLIQYEPHAFSATIKQQLIHRGHQLKPLNHPYGNMHAIYWDYPHHTVRAASDPRALGMAIVK